MPCAVAGLMTKLKLVPSHLLLCMHDPALLNLAHADLRTCCQVSSTLAAAGMHNSNLLHQVNARLEQLLDSAPSAMSVYAAVLQLDAMAKTGQMRQRHKSLIQALLRHARAGEDYLTHALEAQLGYLEMAVVSAGLQLSEQHADAQQQGNEADEEDEAEEEQGQNLPLKLQFAPADEIHFDVDITQDSRANAWAQGAGLSTVLGPSLTNKIRSSVVDNASPQNVKISRMQKQALKPLFALGCGGSASRCRTSPSAWNTF